MKKWLAVLLLFFIFITPTFAQEEDRVTIYFFFSKSCPHCTKERPFLEKLVNENPNFELRSFEISSDKEAQNILQKVLNALEMDYQGIPFTVIGKRVYVGYLNDQTSGRKIERLAFDALENSESDIVGSIIESGGYEEPAEPSDELNDSETITLPLLGEINTKRVSLPVLTIIIGVLDGFNPCAMWALLFLISLLLGMKDRRRMWVLGTAFIVTSAIVYFLFMAAWLNFFLFLEYVVWVRLLIGFIALGAGAYNLREYLVYKEGVCKVTSDRKRRKIFESLKEVSQSKEFFMALIGIVLLAFAVNMIELVCSAGLPAIYTHVLSLSNMPTWKYYLYLLIYVFFFMIDDLFVFLVSMKALKSVGIQSKYARYSHLIGGALMLLIGVLLIFKPELLMFG